jgi:hypothetical protein
MFCFIVLPLSVVRLISFNAVRGDSIPAAATLIVDSPLVLSGALNSSLYLLTRKRLFWGEGRRNNAESTAHAFHTETPPADQDKEPNNIPVCFLHVLNSVALISFLTVTVPDSRV